MIEHVKRGSDGNQWHRLQGTFGTQDIETKILLGS